MPRCRLLMASAAPADHQAGRGSSAKAGVEPCRGMKEFRVAEQAGSMNAGVRSVRTSFQVGQKVDVTGRDDRQGVFRVRSSVTTSRRTAPRTVTRSRTTPGSIGMAQDPGRVFPASAWRASTATSSAPRRIWRSFVWTSSASSLREGCGAGCQGWRRRRPSGGQGLRRRNGI